MGVASSCFFTSDLIFSVGEFQKENKKKVDKRYIDFSLYYMVWDSWTDKM